MENETVGTERHGCDEVTNESTPFVHTALHRDAWSSAMARRPQFQFTDVSHENECHQSTLPWQWSVPRLSQHSSRDSGGGISWSVTSPSIASTAAATSFVDVAFTLLVTRAASSSCQGCTFFPVPLLARCVAVDVANMSEHQRTAEANLDGHVVNEPLLDVSEHVDVGPIGRSLLDNNCSGCPRR